MNSTADGVCPAIKIADTAWHASSLLGNEHIKSMFCLGLGISFKTALVIMPNVPSEPIMSCVRLYPEAYFNVLAPVQIMSPVGKTTSKFNTYSLIVPYFTTCGPPLPWDIFPPIKQEPLLAGSTG